MPISPKLLKLLVYTALCLGFVMLLNIFILMQQINPSLGNLPLQNGTTSGLTLGTHSVDLAGLYLQ